MDIAIIEYQQDIDEALRYFLPQNCRYISVSAEASYHLSRRNIKFLTDEEILTPAEFKTIGNENFEIVGNWIRRLEETLQSKNSLFKERQFSPFRWHLYMLKILLDAVRTKRILIERLIEKENPSLIGAPVGTEPTRIHDHTLAFYKYDSLYGLLAQKITAGKGIEIKTWEKVVPLTKKTPLFDGIKLFSVIRIMKAFKIILESNNLLKQKNIKGNILLGNLCYDIAPLRQELLKDFNFYYYENNNPLCIRSLNSLLKLKLKTLSYKFPEIDIQGVFKTIKATGNPIEDEILGERVQSYAKGFIPILWEGLNYLESLDSQKNFKAYIHHAGASHSFYGLPVYYFNREKKPVIIIQHGSYGFALNRHTEYGEFGHDGYFFAWGDGIKEMYEKRKKGKCQIIATGSHLLEEIKKKSKPRKVISKVCYVPGIYRGYTAYYPNGQPCLDSKLFLMETNFLSALKPYLKRYQITYKVSPQASKESLLIGRSSMLDWIRENLPTINIESRMLESVIHEFDLFIIDFPTTILVQAAASGAEILVYAGNPYWTLEKDALEMLQRRAVVGFDEDDFKEKIKMVLDKGLVVSNIEDTAFLERYGIYLNDGKSLKRMAAKLCELC